MSDGLANTVAHASGSSFCRPRHNSLFAPAGEDAFQLLLVPGFIRDLVFEIDPEADIAKCLRLPYSRSS